MGAVVLFKRLLQIRSIVYTDPSYHLGIVPLHFPQFLHFPHFLQFTAFSPDSIRSNHFCIFLLSYHHVNIYRWLTSGFTVATTKLEWSLFFVLHCIGRLHRKVSILIALIYHLVFIPLCFLVIGNFCYYVNFPFFFYSSFSQDIFLRASARPEFSYYFSFCQYFLVFHFI